MSRLHTMARFSEPDDEEAVAYCHKCSEELYEGEEAFNDKEKHGLLCPNCFEKYVIEEYTKDMRVWISEDNLQ